MAQTKPAVGRSSRSARIAGLASVVVLLVAIYVGFDVNRAIGQSRVFSGVAFPAARILAEIEAEAQECRHAAMHANATLDPRRREALLVEFEGHQSLLTQYLVRLKQLSLPEDATQRVQSLEQKWRAYRDMEIKGSMLEPGSREKQFREVTQAASLIYGSLERFSNLSTEAVRMAFVRVGCELVLLLLGTLCTIAMLAANSEKRKAFENLHAMNDSLQFARSKAEESSKLKSEFLATVSHEIRTPMNGIIGMTELLARSPLNQEQKSYTDSVRTSAEALLAILNDILDLSRIEAGKLTIENGPFAAGEPAFQMAELLAPAAGQKGIEFVIRIAPNLPKTLIGDARRIRQVLMNLAGNAVKFTHSGHVVVEAEAIGSLGDKCQVRFSVHDTGIGIPSDKIDTLFDTFTQADASTTRRYGGTGLGLSISQRLVELMGGSISVDSVEGSGSTFRFDLTLNVPVTATDPTHRPSPRLNLSKALVVEPCEPSATVLSEMLDALGLEHRTARSGAEAYEIVKADPAGWQAVLISSRVRLEEPAQFIRIQRCMGKGNRLLLLAAPGRAASAGAPLRGVRLIPKPVHPLALEQALYETAAVISGRVQQSGSLGFIEDLQQLAAGLQPSPATSGPRVLVAEDNAVNQTIVRKLLEEVGCTVDVASNGRQAVTRWEEGTYDMILMDCQMPELDGFEATREIRRREGTRIPVPIIAITANVLDKDRSQCFAAGMNDFLGKPLRLLQLQQAVIRWGSAPRDADLTPAPTSE